MRWPPVLALIGAGGVAGGAGGLGAGCGGTEPPPAGDVSLVLDLEDGALAPQGFSSVEIVLHQETGDIVRSATVVDGAFDLGAIDPGASLAVEATLRNDSGAAVGYGRTATAAAFNGGAEIVVPVRRPIAYIAGTVSRDADGDAQTPALRWTVGPATYADLSVGGALDGRTTIGSQAVLMVSAGPALYLVSQATSDPNGTLSGPARLLPVSMADHAVGDALAGTMTGAVTDGAGSDDGRALVIGTTQQLYAVDPADGAVRPLADGNFARVAVLTGGGAPGGGPIDAIAIRNRPPTTGPCASTAELWWARLTGTPEPARRIAIGGFTDIATDRGRAYYVDACKGELGEATADGIAALRAIATPGGRATALAVSNGQAYLGVEAAPATTTLLVASLAGGAEPRLLWSEAAQQVLRATELRGVQRQLDASSAVVAHLEIGAGGDYVALTTAARFRGDPVVAANFPGMTIETEELRVFDAATGGVVQRYRSWCSGVLSIAAGDIENWACASTAGQTAAAPSYDHHIHSMAFLYGKK